MAFDITKPTGAQDLSTADDDIRTNFEEIQKGTEHTSASEPSYKVEGTFWYDSTNDLLKVYDGAAWQFPGTLGSWVDKSASYGAQQATTDGFIIAYLTSSSNYASLAGYTDGNADPTTARAISSFIAATFSGSITFPVKKNDYWKIVASNITTIGVYWISLSA